MIGKLTGIIDENNHRHSTYGYDPQGRAISNREAARNSRASPKCGPTS